MIYTTLCDIMSHYLTCAESPSFRTDVDTADKAKKNILVGDRGVLLGIIDPFGMTAPTTLQKGK